MTNEQYIIQLLKDIEGLRIIVDQAKSLEEVKNALDRIQDVLKNYLKSGKTK